jgi:hypothetical protein
MASLVNGKQSKPETQAYGDQLVSISRLHLDPLNPRHEPLKGDAEVIAQLCSAEMVTELAQDIATRGKLSPLDILGVIPFDGHPGHYLTVEGNRRTCALILLSDPSRAPTPALRAQLRKIAATANVPHPIKVHVFPDRVSAKPFIDMRHLGPQGGVGVREWDADQKTRASGENTRTSSRANTLALAVLDRLVQLELLTPTQREKISLTTITRYLGTPGVRAILGLGSANELIYTHDAAEVDAALRTLVLDSIESEIDGSFAVHSRSSSAERLAYANSLKNSGRAPVSALSSPAPAPAATVAPTSSAASTQRNGKRSTRNPADLPTLFDTSFHISHRDPVLLRLRKECLSLKLDDFPFGGNYLLRALIEQVMALFAKKRGKFSANMNDEALTQTCATELKTLGVSGKALTVINKAAGSSATPYSLHSLGHSVHGGSIPTRQALRAHADTWLPSLRAMLDAI